MTGLRYPSISEHAMAELVAEAIAANGQLSVERVDEVVTWTGEPDDDLVSSLEAAAAECREELEQVGGAPAASEGDAVEGRAAPAILTALVGTSTAVLDDPSFWRYVSMRHYWEFIWWREGAFSAAAAYDKRRADGVPVGEGEKRPAAYLDYVSGKKSSECVPLRMYLRARIAQLSDGSSLSSEVPNATDFWRSHIVRVRTGTAPALAQGLIRLQAERRMNTDPLREFARRLNRTWANVMLDLYDDPDEVASLLAELDQRLGPAAQ